MRLKNKWVVKASEGVGIVEVLGIFKSKETAEEYIKEYKKSHGLDEDGYYYYKDERDWKRSGRVNFSIKVRVYEE